MYTRTDYTSGMASPPITVAVFTAISVLIAVDRVPVLVLALLGLSATGVAGTTIPIPEGRCTVHEENEDVDEEVGLEYDAVTVEVSVMVSAGGSSAVTVTRTVTVVKDREPEVVMPVIAGAGGGGGGDDDEGSCGAVLVGCRGGGGGSGVEVDDGGDGGGAVVDGVTVPLSSKVRTTMAGSEA